MKEKKNNTNGNNNAEKIFSVNPLKELTLPIGKLPRWLLEQEELFGELTMQERKARGKQKQNDLDTKVKFGDGANIDMFDLAIMFACYCEYRAGNEVISFKRLYKTLGGGDKLTAPMKKALKRSVEKLMSTPVTIRLAPVIVKETGAAKERVIRDNLLPCKLETLQINGRLTDGAIHLYDAPPIFKHSDLNSQIARCTAELISESLLRSTENTISLAWYLLWRTVAIVGSNSPERKKRVKWLSSHIVFDTVFKICGLEPSTRTQKFKVRQDCLKILDHFTACGLIAGYETIEKNGAMYGLELKLPKTPKKAATNCSIENSDNL